jgi:hypothetical protein
MNKFLLIIFSLCFLGISSHQSMAQADPPLAGGAAARSNSYSGMQHEFRARLDALYAAHPCFSVVSGYRSEKLQNQLRHHRHGRGMVAMGESHHTIGDAADIHGSGNCFQWTHRHAAQFGLYFPMSYEKWHIQTDRRYQGRQFAGGFFDTLSGLFGSK